MKKPLLLTSTLLFLLLISSCNKSLQHLSTGKGKAKNIILLIGDGMGLSQLSSAYYYGDKTPHFSRFYHIGLHQNTPTDAQITDSASGATAFSIGLKTYNAAIGVDKDTLPHETILEWAARNRKSTGLVATSTITHATPASFYAHVAHRNLHEDIALDFLNSPVDFTAAAGYQYFNQRKDGRDLLAELRQKDVIVDTNAIADELIQGQRYTFLLAPDSLLSKQNGRNDFLPKATQKALEYLSQNKDGFFLMVEGSQIDWGGHANDGNYVVTEVLDFNEVVGVALDFAEKDGNTLVVVTADHETGGFSLSAPLVFGRGDYNNIKPTFSTGGHTAALIPVFAYGPGAERFMGVYQNNDIFGKMMAGFK
ncbi:MAG TPA: alkaline phosphatase [Saprospiraceae bacterium]|nr:alkaline phosphatase [Saprospiraceae bacterium]HMQ84235.1 alkaline phosphatase [Saprospiraceae bacterium]